MKQDDRSTDRFTDRSTIVNPSTGEAVSEDMTIASLAQMIGVSKATARRRLERLPAEAVYHKTVDGKDTIFIASHEAVKLIEMERYRSTVLDNVNTSSPGAMTVIREGIAPVVAPAIESLTKQLEIKDAQIQDLTSQNKKLLEIIETLQEQIKSQCDEISRLNEKTQKKGIFDRFRGK